MGLDPGNEDGLELLSIAKRNLELGQNGLDEKALDSEGNAPQASAVEPTKFANGRYESLTVFDSQECV